MVNVNGVYDKAAMQYGGCIECGWAKRSYRYT